MFGPAQSRDTRLLNVPRGRSNRTASCADPNSKEKGTITIPRMLCCPPSSVQHNVSAATEVSRDDFRSSRITQDCSRRDRTSRLLAVSCKTCSRSTSECFWRGSTHRCLCQGICAICWAGNGPHLHRCGAHFELLRHHASRHPTTIQAPARGSSLPDVRDALPRATKWRRLRRPSAGRPPTTRWVVSGVYCALQSLIARPPPSISRAATRRHPSNNCGVRPPDRPPIATCGQGRVLPSAVRNGGPPERKATPSPPPPADELPRNLAGWRLAPRRLSTNGTRHSPCGNRVLQQDKPPRSRKGVCNFGLLATRHDDSEDHRCKQGLGSHALPVWFRPKSR